MKKILLLMLLFSCGAPVAEKPTDPVPTPSPTPKPNPGGKTSFAEAQKIMQTNCFDCHANAGFTKNEAALIASTAKSRVQNSTMPPPYATPISASDKEKFLGFF